MLVSKWGNDLAVRLSADDVARLGLKEGDVVDVEIRRVESSEPAEDVGKLSPEEWLKRMERFSGMMPADFKFNRDEANER
jgi:antitoxin MazE